jgi:hypothetical protein
MFMNTGFGSELAATPPSKADLNAEFPGFLSGRSNQNADEIADQNAALGSKGAIT